jgi:hypothetical protein
VLQPGGLLLLAFHIGDETIRSDEILGQPNSMDWFFEPSDMRRYLEAAGLPIEETIVREPYASRGRVPKPKVSPALYRAAIEVATWVDVAKTQVNLS